MGVICNGQEVYKTQKSDHKGKGCTAVGRTWQEGWQCEFFPVIRTSTRSNANDIAEFLLIIRMSASGYKQTFRRSCRNVRFNPESRHKWGCRWMSAFDCRVNRLMQHKR